MIGKFYIVGNIAYNRHIKKHFYTCNCMETIYFQNASEIKREEANLEKKLKVSIKINGRKAEIEGAPIDEYEATRILEAMQFGFRSEIKREKANLEKKLKVSIKINGRKAEIEGAPIDEYEATRILEAMQFGFSAAKALLMLEEDTIFV